jgi:1-acyl-sn-glycerol-3-phosphate acyltransferase
MRGKPGTFLYFLARRLVKVQIHGEENLRTLDESGPAMLVINHTTVVDVVVVVGTLHKLGYTVDGPCKHSCAHHRHLRPVGTSDMWNFPLAKQIVTGSGIIPTDQHDGRSAYRAARTALKNNECVLMYPEGDVQINTEASPRSWRPGAAALAKSASMPILPIAHHDTRKLGSGSVSKSILQALSKVFHRPTIHLLFSAPVMPNEIADLSMRATNDYLEAKLNEAWLQVKAFN